MGMPNLAQMSMRRRYASSLTLYPIVFLVCWTIPVVKQLILYLGDRSHTDSLPLLIVDALTTPLLGFVNMLVFYYAESRSISFLEVLHRIRMLLTCQCLRRSHELTEYRAALLAEIDVVEQLTDSDDDTRPSSAAQHAAVSWEPTE